MKRGGAGVQQRPQRKQKRPRGKESATTGSRHLSPIHLVKIGKVAGLAVVLVLLAAIYKPIASSSIFDLEEIVIEGNSHFPARPAEALVRQAIDGTILTGELGHVREVLKQQPLIKDAVVTRILPNRLRVELIERKPAAIVKLSGAFGPGSTGNGKASGELVTVDAEGVILGSFELMGDHPPLLGCINEGALKLSRSTNLDRLRLYLELKEVLNEPELAYWDKIDSVDIRDLSDVVISLRDSPATEIHLGDRHFRQRFDRLLQELARRGLSLSNQAVTGGLQLIRVDARVNPPDITVRRPTIQPSTTPTEKAH